jgi:hypothetical protein
MALSGYLPGLLVLFFGVTLFVGAYTGQLYIYTPPLAASQMIFGGALMVLGLMLLGLWKVIR